MMAHGTMWNFPRDCLSAPIFEDLWRGEPMSYQIQFRKDNPEYNLPDYVLLTF